MLDETYFKQNVDKYSAQIADEKYHSEQSWVIFSWMQNSWSAIYFYDFLVSGLGEMDTSSN